MTIRSLRTFFDEKKVVLVFLILLCVTAFYLRSHNVLNRMRWDGDPARDLLVSKHMAFYGESLIVGHTASGATIYDKNHNFKGVLHYPTFYYSYLTLLWKIFNSIEGIILFNIFLHVLSLLGIYLLIVLFTSHRWSALSTVALFTISEHFIDISQSIIGLQVSLPFVILSCLLLGSGWKYKHNYMIFIGISSLTFFTTFNYALLIIVGWVLVFSIFLNRKKPLQAVLLITSQIVFFFVLHIQQIVFFGFDVFVQAFLQSNTGDQLQTTTVWNLLQERIWIPLQSVFPRLLPLITFIFSFLLGLSFLRKKQFSQSAQITLVFVILVIASFFLLAITKSGVFIESYLYYANVLIVMFFGICFGSLLKTDRKYKKGLRIGFAITLIIWMISLFHGLNFNHYLNSIKSIDNDREKAKSLARKILVEFNSPQFFDFNLSAHYDMSWETPTVGYWLEELSSEKIYSLENYSNNLEASQLNEKPVVVSASYIYSDNDQFTKLSTQNARQWKSERFPQYREYKREIFDERYLLIYLRKE